MRRRVEKTLESLSLYFRASIIDNILVLTIFLTAYVTVLCVLQNVGITISAPALPFTTALTLVTSFLLVFRTNTAYDRFWEGRRLWANIRCACRILGRLIWASVKDIPVPVNVSNTFNPNTPNNNSNLNSVVAPVRQSPSPRLPSESNSPRLKAEQFDGIVLTPQKQPEDGKVFRDKEKALDLLKDFPRSLMESLRRQQKSLKENSYGKWKRRGSDPLLIQEYGEKNHPILCLDLLGRWIQRQRLATTIDAATASLMENQLNVLTDAWTGCERILKTPIPKAYAIHLDHILFIYCVTFPFTIIGTFQWWTILISFIVFYVLLGVRAIGEEIENPFGNDHNDLPLELFVESIDAEIDCIRLLQ